MKDLTVTLRVKKDRINKKGLHPLYLDIYNPLATDPKDRRKVVFLKDLGVKPHRTNPNATDEEIFNWNYDDYTNLATGNREAYLQGKREAILYESELRALPAPVVDDPDDPASGSFYSYLRTFITRYRNTTYYRLRERAIEKLEEYMAREPLPIRNVTSDLLRSFQLWLQAPDGKNMSSAGAFSQAFPIRAAIKELIGKDLLKPSILINVKQIKVSSKMKEPLSEEELITLWKTDYPHNPDLKKAFLFCCYTLLRGSDVKKLTYMNIRKVSDNRYELHYKQQKENRAEYVELHSDALRLLDLNLVGTDNKLFPKLPVRQDSRNYRLKDWLQLAKIYKHITWHSSKTTGIVEYLRSDVDFPTVSKLAFHTTIRSTIPYLNLRDEHKNNAVRKRKSLLQ